MLKDRLSELNRKRPFQPFRVRMKTGELVSILEPNRCVVLPTRFVTDWEGHARHFPIEDVEAIEVAQFS